MILDNWLKAVKKILYVDKVPPPEHHVWAYLGESILIIQEFKAALEDIKAHGCCIMHNDDGCPGCRAHDALKSVENLYGETK